LVVAPDDTFPLDKVALGLDWCRGQVAIEGDQFGGVLLGGLRGEQVLLMKV
jgi:hypothetical protein